MWVAEGMEDERTREVEVVDLGSQRVGSVAHVGPETLQNRHQSYGVSRTEASRRGAGTGKSMEGQREVGVSRLLEKTQWGPRLRNSELEGRGRKENRSTWGTAEQRSAAQRGCRQDVLGAKGEVVSSGTSQFP